MPCRSVINSGSTGELIVLIDRSYKNIYWAITSKQDIFSVKSHGELIHLIMQVNERNEDTLVSDVLCQHHL